MRIEQPPTYECPMRAARLKGPRRIGCTLLMICLLAMGGQALAQVKVVVHETSRVSDPWVRLRTVASISAPKALKDKIGAVRLCQAPQPGRRITLSGMTVSSILAAARVLPATAKVSVPDSIQVIRESQRIGENRLKALYKKYIADHLGGTAFKVRGFRVLGDNRFALGPLSLFIQKNFNPNFKGTVSLRVRVSVGGKQDGWLSLQGWVDRFGRVVCARRPVTYNSILTPADLQLKRVNMSDYPSGLLTDLSSAVGRVCKVTLFPGTPLRISMLATVPLVARGQRVEIRAAGRGLRVSAVGIAETAGGMGQQVMVQNIHSGKTVVGRVTGAATVAVIF